MASNIATLIFLVLTIILLSVSGGYATNAAVRVTKIPAYKQNKKLDRAHRLLSGAAVATWIGVALIIFLFILYLIFGVESEAYTGGTVYNLLLLITIGLVILVGILSAIAANDIRTSKINDNKNSFRQSVIAASLNLGVLGLIIIIFIVRSLIKKKNSDQ